MSRDTPLPETTPADGDLLTDDGASPAALRARLIEKLRTEGVLHDSAVAHAMETVPRHLFLPGLPLDQAYADIAVATHFEDGIPISSASQPAIVALMLRQLQPVAGMRVLEIGAGTGYNAALLAELTGSDGHVTTVDIDEPIAAEARTHLREAGYSAVEVITADGAAGWPPHAPYDRIELTVGASDISPAWVEQLRDGGLLVMPLWMGASDVSIAFRRHGERLKSESLTPCGFMRLRGSEGDALKWVNLPGGWRIASERAAQIAPTVAELLRTRPRRRFWARSMTTAPGFAQFLGAQYLALNGLEIVTLWPVAERKGRARVRQRLGLYAEGSDGPSLCLLGSVLPILLTFGGTAAERQLTEAWTRWQSSRMLPMDAWHVTAYPTCAAPATPPPGYTARHIHPHYTYDIRFLIPKDRSPR
jgi:protein-L-isoaspartate(D-aspartate) O-methyltransferase